LYRRNDPRFLPENQGPAPLIGVLVQLPIPMKITRFAIILIAVAVAAVSSAQSVVGKWHGHFKLDAAMRKQIPAAQMPNILEAEKATIELTLKGDKSYTATQIFRKQSHTEIGTWTATKTSVVLKASSLDGRAATGSATRTFQLVGGKKLTTTLPGGTITYVR